jgi:hypothetical protein
MAFHHSPQIITDNLTYMTDPLNTKSWNGSTLTDLAGSKSMTVGANCEQQTTYGLLHFGSTGGPTGTGTLDTGYRYGLITSGDKVVDSAASWTTQG